MKMVAAQLIRVFKYKKTSIQLIAIPKFKQDCSYQGEALNVPTAF